jgi:outer membrane murein-binding lipoprotein Lpp
VPEWIIAAVPVGLSILGGLWKVAKEINHLSFAVDTLGTVLHELRDDQAQLRREVSALRLELEVVKARMEKHS